MFLGQHHSPVQVVGKHPCSQGWIFVNVVVVGHFVEFQRKDAGLGAGSHYLKGKMVLEDINQYHQVDNDSPVVYNNTDWDNHSHWC